MEIFILGQNDIKLYFTEILYNRIKECLHKPEYSEVMTVFQKQNSLGLELSTRHAV